MLIGESANKRVVEGIRKLAQDFEDIDRVHELLTMHVGPDSVLVTISVKFLNESRAEDIESTIARLDTAIKRNFRAVKRVFVEAEARADEATIS